MGIETLLIMIPKGGKYAKSVVNFVHKVPQNWEKFKSAIQQIEKILKQGKLRLDGKQKTNFEANKNILKIHEKVTKKVEVPPSVKKEFPPFNVSKEDFTKGWTPTLHERSNLRNVYKKLEPPKEKYTAEMEAIDEELDALSFGGEKYEGFSVAEKNKLIKKLQTEMQKLIKVAKENDPTKLSLSQLNKKSQNLQKRIREIADNPDIKGTVTEGPKRDMIKALYDSEKPGLTKAQVAITKRNSELKYGKKYPVLDPENDAFIVLGLDSSGNPNKMSRFTGKFSATKDKTTGELTSGEGTSFYDKWNSKTGTLREEGKEVFHETLNREGKVIMSNPEYKLPKTGNMEIQNEFYTDLSTSDLAKKGYTLKQVDMIRKGREARKYLEKTQSPDVNIRMHEQTSTNEIGAVMEDLYHRGDDIYKMSMKEWITKIPEHFAEGGQVPGFATGGVSNLFRKKFHRGSLRHQKEHDWKSYEDKGNFMRYLALSGDRARMSSPENVINRLLNNPVESPARDDFETYMKERFMYGEHIPPNVFKQIVLDFKEMYKKLKGSKKRKEHATGGVSNLFRERQGYRSAGEVIKLVKGARWLIRMLKEMSDDMIFGHGKFANMAEALKMKYFKQTEAAIKSLESGGPIPDEILTSLRQDARFKDLTVSKGGDKEFLEIQEVVLGKPTKGTVVEQKYLEKGIAEGAAEQIENIDLMKFKNTLPKDLLDKVNQLPVEKQTNLLIVMKKAFDAAKKGNIKSGVDVLQEQLLTDFIPKGKPHATGGLIDGYATGGVSNLFRSR
jgi:hypothetical protein